MQTITIPGVPEAHPRPRARRIGENVGIYQPRTEYATRIKLFAGTQWTGPLLDGPVTLYALFLFPRTKGQMWKRKPMPRLPHTKKPDADNVLKALFDALQGIVFTDDCRINNLACGKWICAGDEEPQTVVGINEWATQVKLEAE